MSQKMMLVLKPLNHLEDYVLRNIRILESSDWKGPERSSILKCAKAALGSQLIWNRILY